MTVSKLDFALGIDDEMEGLAPGELVIDGYLPLALVDVSCGLCRHFGGGHRFLLLRG